MAKKDESVTIRLPYLMVGLMIVLLVITVFQSFQIAAMSSAGVKTTGAVVEKTTAAETRGSRTGISLQQIIDEITPTGIPDYGAQAGVSYENVEAGLRTLMGYHDSISLNGNNQQRYINIATTRGTACEFCCGIGEAGFGTSNGQIACACSHNIAFSGLTKWLIENTDYTDQQIIDEIHKWKVLFFPQGSVEKELQKRNINPESVGLKSMVGGC